MTRPFGMLLCEGGVSPQSEHRHPVSVGTVRPGLGIQRARMYLAMLAKEHFTASEEQLTATRRQPRIKRPKSNDEVLSTDH